MTRLARRVAARFAVYPYRTTLLVVCGLLIAFCGWLGYNGQPGSPMQVTVYRVIVLTALASSVVFVAVYTRLARWWRHPLGRTIVAVDAAVFFALLPIALSLFFSFSRLTSQLAAGLDLAAVSSIPLTMAWRIYAWLQIPHLPGHNVEEEQRRAPDTAES